MAIHLRDLPESVRGRAALSLLDLAPGGVCRATPVARSAGALLPHRFTLAAPKAGGLFSVALSCESPRLAVSQHPALRSPDLPQPVQARAAAIRPAPRRRVQGTCPEAGIGGLILWTPVWVGAEARTVSYAPWNRSGNTVIDLERLVAAGLRAGLHTVGVCRADPFSETARILHERKDAGLHGGMQFTYRNPDRSTDPGRLLPGAVSLVVGVLDYHSRAPAERDVEQPDACERPQADGLSGRCGGSSAPACGERRRAFRCRAACACGGLRPCGLLRGPAQRP